MRMRHENMFDAGLLGQVQGRGDRTGIEEDVRFHEKGGEVLAGEVRAGAAEHAQIHVFLQIA